MAYPVPKLLPLEFDQPPPAAADQAFRLLTEQSIKRSRFITSLGRARDRAEARLFIDWIKGLYPDATHNCWAFNAGPPGDTGQIGQSDAGEPHGTAGKPILNQILHYPGGEIVIVVTRYFGGTKLGSGGLVRAYQSSAAQALAQLELETPVTDLILQISAPYDLSGPLPALFASHQAKITSEQYAEQTIFEISLPQTNLQALNAALRQLGLTAREI